MRGNFLVAICDILGFSKLILNNDVETVLRYGVDFLKKTLLHSIYKNEFLDYDVPYKELKTDNDLGISWFSDTILIYSRRDDNDACKKLLQTVGWLIFENMLSPNTRIRAGISYGEAFINEQEEIYIGKAIVDAYMLEKKQKWIGGALSKKVEERYGDYLATLNPIESWVVPYDVPVENGLTEKCNA